MNGGFDKIEITEELPKNKIIQKPNNINTINPMSEKNRNKKPKKIIKFILFLFIFIIIFGIIGGLAVYFPAKKTILSAKETYDSAKEVYDLIKKQDVINAGEKLKVTKEKLLLTEKNLSSLSWTGMIPIIGNYYKDATHGLRASVYGVEAGDIVIEAIKPHADLLGLKGQGSFVMGSAEERIQKTVQTMDKITPQLGEVEKKLTLMRKEIDQIDVNRYPEEFQGKKIRSQLILAKKILEESSIAISDARPVIEALPKLLGEPTPKKYLILFQNDKELRSTGGFLTAYAVFRFEHGKAYAEKSEDIYKLDATRTKNLPAPDPILKYLPNVPYWYLRDSNISPDYVVSMKNFEKIYSTVSDQVEYDGIFALDTHVLYKIMEVLGSMEIDGINFSTEIVPECNCPRVIYELEKYADERVGYIKTDRKDIIGKLMYGIMQKALSSSPKLYWGRLFQVGIDELNQKHILIYLLDDKAQKGIEAVNFAGRIRDFDGDYLHINDTNFGGAKANMYVNEEVTQKYEKEKDGSMVKTITIKYKNPYPESNCNLETGKLCLNALLRDWLRIYVPKGSQLIEAKGSEVKFKTYEELGKTVFDGFLTVRPMGSAQVTVKYKLPFIINNNQDLNLMIQKQPGTDANKYIIESGGKIQEFNLITDKIIKVKL